MLSHLLEHNKNLVHFRPSKIKLTYSNTKFTFLKKKPSYNIIENNFYYFLHVGTKRDPRILLNLKFIAIFSLSKVIDEK